MLHEIDNSVTDNHRDFIKMMFSAAVVLLLHTIGFVECQIGACIGTQSYYASVSRYATRQIASGYYYTVCCGWSCWSRCGRYGVRYRSQGYYYYTSEIRYRTYHYCCTGYSGYAPYYCSPVCSQGCVHGSCTSPNSCSCNNGWTGSSCNIDINECASNNGGCDQNCANNVGSYTCSCDSGYTLSNDQRTCQDNDECAGGLVMIGGTSPWGSGAMPDLTETYDWCEQRCVNTDGGYMCGCLSGYSLQGDNVTCSDINECDFLNGRCEHMCYNTEGSYFCTCRDGFLLLDDGLGCTDHDECKNNSHGCEHECHNTHGSYRCACYDGYRLNGTTDCEDIDECSEDLSGCSDICLNYEGYYECDCLEGFELTGDNKTCIDTNECMDGNGGCDHICSNRLGSYKCFCRDGYTLSSDEITCNADLCLPVLAPFNGDIQCTNDSRPQVTDDVCNFTCHIGYELVGSKTRACQPNHTWSGEEVYCEILQCSELTAPENAFVAQPCVNEYSSSCRVLCNEGYRVNTTSMEMSTNQLWTQTCALNNETGLVNWTETNTCAEIKICYVEPPPCGPGICSVDSEGQIQCDCEGTYHSGERCQIASAFVDPIKTLSVREEFKVKISTYIFKATGQRRRSIRIKTNSNNLRVLSAQELAFPDTVDGLSSISFRLVANNPGRYIISYEVLPSSNFIQLEDSAVLAVSSQNDQEAMGYFGSNDVEMGILRPGCCYKVYNVENSLCATTRLFLASSCDWSIPFRDTAKGIIFMIIDHIHLPLSIAGISDNLSFRSSFSNNLNTLEFALPPVSSSQQYNDECKYCTERLYGYETGNCYNPDPPISFGAQDTQTFLKHDAILRTFIKWLKTHLPTWVTISLPGSSAVKDEFASYDFMASLLNAQDISKQAGCETLDFENHQSSKKYYVLRTTSTLQVSFYSSGDYLASSSVSTKPQCIVLDICSGSNDLKLHYSIPANLQPAKLTSARIFKYLSGNNGSLTYSSIKLFLGKRNEQYIEDTVQYWNGAEFFKPQLSSFEFIINNFQMNKVFSSTDSDLQVKIIFSGLVFYQSNPLAANKIPGLLKGTLSIEISTAVNGKLETLHLNSISGSAASVSLFTIPGTMASQSTDVISPGLAFKLEYNTLRSTSLFSEILEPFDSTSGSQCMVDGFMSLDESFTLKSINLTSNCLSPKINQLRLPTAFNFTFIIFTDSASYDHAADLSNNSTIIVRSSTKIPQANIGNFIRSFRSSANSDLNRETVEIIHHVDRSLSGSVRDVNISIFDSEIYMEKMPIERSALSIEGTTTVFNHLNVNITGTASTETNINSMVLEIDAEVTDDEHGFKRNLTETLNKQLQAEIKSVLERRENAEILFVKAGIAYNDTSIRFDETLAEKQLLSETLDSVQAKVEQLQLRVNETERAFQTAFLEHSNLMSSGGLDAICTEEDCEDICEPGVSCSTCYVSSTVEALGTCQTPVTAFREVTEYHIVATRSWRYEYRCRRSWRLYWFFVPIFSFRSRCSRACVSYIKYSQVPLRIVRESYTKLEKTSCPTKVFSEDIPSECCQEYPCARMVRDFDCLLRNENCQRLRQQELRNANSTVQAAYSLYTQTKANLTLSQVELEQVRARYSSVDQRLKLIEEAKISASNTLEIRRQSKDRVFENTKLFDRLIEAYNHGYQYIIEIDQIFWHVSLTSETRVVLPITIRYHYINQTDQVTFVLNLQDSPEAHDRFVSIEVLDQVVGQGGRRRKRQASYETVNYLAEVCAELENLDKFLSQLIDSLDNSTQNFQSNTDKLNNLLNTTNAIQYNNITSNDSEFAVKLKQSLTGLQNEKALAVTAFSSLLKENSFIEWQKGTEMIYQNGSDLNGVECTSFADCLQTALTSLELILVETPGDKGDSIQEKLNLNRNSILNVALSENYTFDDAMKSLEMFEDLLSEVSYIDYWCADPPVIINTPPLEVNISIGDTLNIDCIVSSSLPVQYYWKRDSLLLSATGSKLSVQAIQMSESGQYQCTAVNDAGRVSSITTTVNVYYSPIFNQTLQDTPLIETYDGYDNGISLNCDAHSWPPPGWIWLYRATQSDDWSEIYDVDANILTLDKISLMDEGWYTCVAYNWLGNDTSSPLFVHVLPAQIPSTKYLIEIEFEAFSFSINDVFDNLDQVKIKMVEGIRKQIPPLSSVLVHSLEVSQLNDTSGNDTILASFYISTPIVEYNNSFTTEDLIVLTASALTDLDRVKNNITNRAAQPSGFEIEIDDVILNSVALDVDPRLLSCPNGYEIHSNQIICVGCRSGYINAGSIASSALTTSDGQYMEQLVSVCEECIIGEYQPYRAQSLCIKCPLYHTTISTGRTELEECIGLCEPHTYSADGLPPCEQCPTGFCQPEYGRDECIPCPDSSASIMNDIDRSAASSTSTGRKATSTQTMMADDKSQSTSITVSSNAMQSPNTSSNDTNNSINEQSGGTNTVAAVVGTLSTIFVIIVIVLVIANAVILILRRKWQADKMKNPNFAAVSPLNLPENAAAAQDIEMADQKKMSECDS